MAKKIFLVGGSKGGVGKSMVTAAVVERLVSAGEKVLLIETDTSNPDVYNAYGTELPSRLLDLDGPNGWIELVNLCDKEPETTVVVNTAARNNRGVDAYGETLRDSLDELGRTLVTLWVINAERDSVELLRSFMEVIPNSELHVVRNTYFGNADDFQLYDSSKTKAKVEGRGGRSVNFPVLGSRVANDLRTNRLSISRALKEMPLGHRAELRRWKNLVDQTLADVVTV
jgi:hypothetical protein